MLLTMFEIKKTKTKKISYAQDLTIKHNGKTTIIYAVKRKLPPGIGTNEVFINALTTDKNGEVIFTDQSIFIEDHDLTNTGKYKEHIKKFCVEYLQLLLEKEVEEAFKNL